MEQTTYAHITSMDADNIDDLIEFLKMAKAEMKRRGLKHTAITYNGHKKGTDLPAIFIHMECDDMYIEDLIELKEESNGEKLGLYRNCNFWQR